MFAARPNARVPWRRTLAVILLPGPAWLLLLAATVHAAEPTSVYPEPPGDQERFITRFGVELVPLEADFPLRAIGAGVGTSVSCPVGALFSFVETWMAPPNGARVLGFDLHGHDASSDSQALFAFRVCQQPVGTPSPSAITTLLGSATNGSVVNGPFVTQLDLTAGNEIADGNSCRYLLRLRLSNQNQPCVGDGMQVHKVVMRYRAAD